MDSFTDEELKLPPVKYECNDNFKTVDEYDKLHYLFKCLICVG
jgi:hypothetical protein